MRKTLKCSFFCCTVSGAAMLAAQAATAQTAANAPGQARRSGPPVLEEIVVTAQKREQTLQEVPVSLDVLSSETLAVQQVYSVEDLAAFNPSLNFRLDANATNTAFSLRGIGGFAAQSGIEPAIGMVVDGVPYARGAEFFAAQLEDIQRVEILKGPQGTLFGASNAGGVVNIVSKRPTEEFEAAAEGSGTSDEEFTGRVMMSGALTEGIRARVSAFVRTREGHLKNIFADEGDLSRLGEQKSIGFRGMLDFDLGPDATLLLTGEYNEIDRSNARQPIVVENGPVGAARLAAQGLGDPVLGQRVIDDLFLVAQDGADEEDIDRWRISATLNWSLTDSISLTSISSYTDFDDNSDIDVDSSPAGPFNNFGLITLVGVPRTNTNIERPIDSRTFTATANYVTQELRLEGTGEVLDWTAGGYYQNLQDNFNISTPLINGGNFISGPRFANIDRQLFSAFADATWHGPAGVDIFGGIRFIQERGRVDFRRSQTVVPYTSPLLTLLPDDGGTVIVDPSVLNNINNIRFKAGTSPTGWAGRTGISWEYSPEANFYFTVSRGFTGFGVNTGNTTTADTAFVRPSTSRSFEAGTKMELMDSLRFNLALFATEVKDLQANVNPGAGAINTFNAGRLKSKGVEGDLTWVVPGIRDLTLNASFTLMDTDIKDLVQPCFPGQTAAQGCLDLDGNSTFEQDLENKPGVDAPNQAFNIRARYDIYLSETADMPFNMYIAPSYTWKSEVAFNIAFDPRASFQKAYGLLDLTIGFVSEDERYELIFFGKNMLDKQFASNVQLQANVTGLASAGVSRDARDRWGGALKVRF